MQGIRAVVGDDHVDGRGVLKVINVKRVRVRITDRAGGKRPLTNRRTTDHSGEIPDPDDSAAICAVIDGQGIAGADIERGDVRRVELQRTNRAAGRGGGGRGTDQDILRSRRPAVQIDLRGVICPTKG